VGGAPPTSHLTYLQAEFDFPASSYLGLIIVVILVFFSLVGSAVVVTPVILAVLTLGVWGKLQAASCTHHPFRQPTYGVQYVLRTLNIFCNDDAALRCCHWTAIGLHTGEQRDGIGVLYEISGSGKRSTRDIVHTLLPNHPNAGMAAGMP